MTSSTDTAQLHVSRRDPLKLPLILLGVLLLFLFPSGVLLADEEPLPLDAYWDLVRSHLETLQGLPSDVPPTAETRLILASMAGDWEGVDGVILEDGSLINVYPRYFTTLLRAEEPDIALLEQQYTSLLAANGAWVRGELTAEELQALVEILARPEFHEQQEERSPFQEWLQELREKLLKALADLFPDVEGGSAGVGGGLGELFRVILPLAGAFVLMLVIVFVVRGLSLGMVAEARLDQDIYGDEALLTASAAFERAQTLSKGEDYRSAVRYLYLSTLLLLEERGVLRYDRSLTNREYARSLRQLPQVSAVFRSVVDVFERVWYGNALLDAAAYARYEKQIKDLGQQL